MNERTERYRQHLDRLYAWLREDTRAIEHATALLLRNESPEMRSVALQALAHATERAKWCNDRIAEMASR